MKRFTLPVLLALASIATAATPDLIQTCSSLPATAPAGALIGCPTTNVGWGPRLTTDLVRIQQASAGNAQKWVPYSTVAAADKVVRKSTGTWDTFSNVAVSPAPTPPVPVPVATVTTVVITWTVPTQNADGSPLTDLKSYNVYQGGSEATLVKVGSIVVPMTAYTTPALSPGTYYFAVTAVDSIGNESARTPAVSTVVAPPPTKIPGTPSNLKITVIVTAGP
jgi:hypothetical protein